MSAAPSEVNVRVTSTRYGRAALDALRAAVASAKRDDPMSPVTVIVPNNIAGIVARRHLAGGLTDDGNGIAGIWFTTLARLAEQIAAPELTADGRRPASRAFTASAIRRALHDEPGLFEPVSDHPSTVRALATAHAALRDVDAEHVDRVRDATSLAADVVRVHRSVNDLLSSRTYDHADVLATATEQVTTGRTTVDGAVIVYLPQDLSRAETAFARAIVTGAETTVIAGLTGDHRADRGPRATVGELTGIRPSPPTPAPSIGEPSIAHRVLTASDSDDEVRCVVREVVSAVRTTPAHRIAVLYAARAPYARLLAEHLGAAGLTVNGAGVLPVVERACARLVLGLLELARTGYRRDAVFRVLGGLGIQDFTGERISVPRWERVSREAGVIAG